MSGAATGIVGLHSTSAGVAGGPPALTLRRRGSYDVSPDAAFQDPAAVTASYTLLAADADADVSFAADSDLPGGVWAPFAATGALPHAAIPSPGMPGGHAAAAARIQLLPGETRTVTLVFAWHVPNRTYVGQEVGK